MGIKYFCDQCSKEIERDYVSERLKKRMGDFEIGVLVSYQGTANNGNICLDCLKQIILHGDDVA